MADNYKVKLNVDHIHIRLPLKEKEQIAAKALKEGLTLSMYLRRLASIDIAKEKE
jgi:hypothetical protein